VCSPHNKSSSLPPHPPSPPPRPPRPLPHPRSSPRPRRPHESDRMLNALPLNALPLNALPLNALPLPSWRDAGRGDRIMGQNAAYQYYFFPKMAMRYPSAAGFLFTSSDVILLYWNYGGANKSRLWLSDASGCPACRPPFISFSPPVGKTHFESASQKQGVKGAIHMMELQYRAQLTRIPAASQRRLPSASLRHLLCPPPLRRSPCL